ncbi:hypothetical protein EXN67_01500 [Rhizobium rhizogenes]|nr:hypothetical protein [Rhizobium rhizogenes]TRB14323.1 hypothetical protein EXN67_01500 [Rhizobium rhizogenes]TRB47113.1 hypothetical protein EXN73_01500 [Rhizobium rhizogenes]TRB64880.1 hypothetical protein EXN71_01500 [Rhizobium rhizogenes]
MLPNHSAAGFGPPPPWEGTLNIRMLVGLSGNEYSLSPGDEREFPQNEAIRLIEAGYAVPVAEDKVERAVAQIVAERRSKKGKTDVVSGENNSGGDI